MKIEICDRLWSCLLYESAADCANFAAEPVRGVVRIDCIRRLVLALFPSACPARERHCLWPARGSEPDPRCDTSGPEQRSRRGIDGQWRLEVRDSRCPPDLDDGSPA